VISSTPVLSPQLFAIWSALIRERLGLSYAAQDRELLGEKLWARAQEAGFTHLLDYYYFLRYDDVGHRELDALAEALVVGESYLFRELEQIEVAVDELLGPAVRARGQARVWSAACANGEEPLTLAMALAARGLLEQVSIVATDLSRRALARAQAHTYTRRALRGDPPPRYRRFYEVGDNQVRVSPALAASIDWRRVNLAEPGVTAGLGDFDVVLCRNVLIYFDDETVVDVVRRLAASLRPGGALLVGISESLLRLNVDLACEQHGGVFIYRKAA
jgi:chemotaxis protein methyltransferase CheR